MNSVQTMRTTAPVKTYIGPDSSRMVGDLLREQGVDSVLIVTDKNIEAAGLLAGVEDSLRTAGCSFIVYDETPADPPDTAGVDRLFVDGGGAYVRPVLGKTLPGRHRRRRRQLHRLR